MTLKDLSNAEKQLNKEINKNKRRFIMGIIIGVILLIGLCVAAIFSTSTKLEEPLDQYKYREVHICDYCGHKQKVSVYSIEEPEVRIILFDRLGNPTRKLCTSCFILVFDRALGYPKYKEVK